MSNLFEIRTPKKRFALISHQRVVNYRFDLGQKNGRAAVNAFLDAPDHASLHLRQEMNTTAHGITYVIHSDEEGVILYEPGLLIQGDADKVKWAVNEYKKKSTDESVQSVFVRDIEEREYLVFTLKGSYAGLPDAWPAAMAALKTVNREKDSSAASFEIYENEQSEVKEEDLITTIWLPLV
ncbi:hypothetical protein HDU97_008878 [Phlyctochytrium planicorne]|nr:hypothetical protein HDU97_008878 [Phlyctochytrium planicorne]